MLFSFWVQVKDGELTWVGCSMETARTFIDLTISQTIHNFTNTHFILPHGAFLFLFSFPHTPLLQLAHSQ